MYVNLLSFVPTSCHHHLRSHRLGILAIIIYSWLLIARQTGPGRSVKCSLSDPPNTRWSFIHHGTDMLSQGGVPERTRAWWNDRPLHSSVIHVSRCSLQVPPTSRTLSLPITAFLCLRIRGQNMRPRAETFPINASITSGRLDTQGKYAPHSHYTSTHPSRHDLSFSTHSTITHVSP